MPIAGYWNVFFDKQTKYRHNFTGIVSAVL